jgi:hypothetical protein
LDFEITKRVEENVEKERRRRRKREVGGEGVRRWKKEGEPLNRAREEKAILLT